MIKTIFKKLTFINGILSLRGGAPPHSMSDMVKARDKTINIHLNF